MMTCYQALKEFLAQRHCLIESTAPNISKWLALKKILAGSGVLIRANREELKFLLAGVKLGSLCLAGTKQAIRHRISETLRISRNLTAEEYWIKVLRQDSSNEKVLLKETTVRRMRLIEEGSGSGRIDGFVSVTPTDKYVLEVKLWQSKTYDIFNGIVQLGDYLSANDEYAGGILLVYIPKEIDVKAGVCKEALRFMRKLSRCCMHRGKEIGLFLLAHSNGNVVYRLLNDKQWTLLSNDLVTVDDRC